MYVDYVVLVKTGSFHSSLKKPRILIASQVGSKFEAGVLVEVPKEALQSSNIEEWVISTF